MSLQTLNSLVDLERILREAGDSRLVVIDFHALWSFRLFVRQVFFFKESHLCRATDAHLDRTAATQFPQATFCKCDVDKARDVAQRYNVSAMPTFKFIKNGQEVAQVRGADPRTLSATVAQHAGSAPSVASTDSVSSPHGKSLLSQLDKSSLSCLNEAAAHSLKDLLGHGYLQSDADEQLIIHLPFQQAVKVRALKFRTDSTALSHAPKAIKLFVNNPTIGFDDASSSGGEQSFELTEAQAQGEEAVELRYVKFQKVLSLSVFIESNQGDEDETRIDSFEVLGDPGQLVNDMQTLRSGDAEE